MIPRSPGSQQLARWQTLLGQAITDPQELLRELELPQHLLPAARQPLLELIRQPDALLITMLRRVLVPSLMTA